MGVVGRSSGQGCAIGEMSRPHPRRHRSRWTRCLAAILQSGVGARAGADRRVGRRRGRTCSAFRTRPIFPLRLVFDAGRRSSLCGSSGLGRVQGAHLRLVGKLKPLPRRGRARPVDRRTITSSLPTGRLGDSKGTVRQHAKRCRDEFAEQYEVVEGRQARPPTFWFTRRTTTGYRLDPEARFVDGRDRAPRLDRAGRLCNVKPPSCNAVAS